MKFGLIGKNIDYSFSKEYFTHKFLQQKISSTYENIDVDNLKDIRKKLIDNEFDGVNVTIPFKQLILPYVDELSWEAQEIGAINCIKIKGDYLIGHNTDAIGFQESLMPLLDENKMYKALVFGNGGAALAVKYVLLKLEIDFKVVSRTGKYTYSEINKNEFQSPTILINTTPLGTFPNVDSAVDIPYKYINEETIAHDLVYHPTKTLFLQKAEDRGAKIKNGLEMLQKQADASYEIWIKGVN